MARTAAVFFDVDFTLIRPGPRFEGAGYRATCLQHGLSVDPDRFQAGVAAALPLLDAANQLYDADLFIAFTRRIIEAMGGTGERVDAAAREIYEAWADHRHFMLYDDVVGALEMLRRRHVGIGLISNSHRPLDSFLVHFNLGDLISVVISSAEHRYMKPHPEIFRVALAEMGVDAGDAVMVGDSLAHDVAGARRAGMRAILIDRAARSATSREDVDVIRSLDELEALI